MTTSPKIPPTYAIASVDHALRLAVVLQLEGSIGVADAAARLGVARSTAHRILSMLVYRDFAVQDEHRAYHAGPILDLAAHSRAHSSFLRTAALPHLQRLAARLDETINLTIRTGITVRFLASVEGTQSLRVSSREGMVFAAHRTTAGLLLLSDLDPDELESVYAVSADPVESRLGQLVDRPHLPSLKVELEHIRNSGFAVNDERSERGVVAVGVPVRDAAGALVAGLAVSIPSIRYDKQSLPALVGTLRVVARTIESDLRHRSEPTR